MDFGLAGKSFHDTREMREHLTWLIYPRDTINGMEQ